MNQRKNVVIYKSPPLIKLEFFSPKLRWNQKKIGARPFSCFWAFRSCFPVEKCKLVPFFGLSFLLRWAIFPTKTNQKGQHKQWHLSLATDVMERGIDRFIHLCCKCQSYSMKYQKISALYDKMKLPQIVFKYCVAILVTCNKKLSSITLGNG